MDSSAVAGSSAVRRSIRRQASSSTRSISTCVPCGAIARSVEAARPHNGGGRYFLETDSDR